MDHGRKKVSILIPCRNEVHYISRCVKNVYDFEPPEGGFEVIVMDGLSNDGTREVLMDLRREHQDLIIVENPGRTVPYAMNAGVRRATGEFIIRADVRCIHPKNYIRDLVALSEKTGADNVGGVLVPMGGTYVQNSIAAAYKSPIGMGGALRDRGDFIGEAGAVYGGCFRRERLLEIGMYDEDMVRNQDDELSFRLRKSGGKVIQSGQIKVRYFPRTRLLHLFKQFLQYGYWKVRILRKHPGQASLRHLAPALLVLGMAGLGLGALVHPEVRCGLVFWGGSYALAISLEAFRLSSKFCLRLFPGIAASIASIHMGYGIGFILGILNGFIGHKSKWFETLSR